MHAYNIYNIILTLFYYLKKMYVVTVKITSDEVNNQKYSKKNRSLFVSFESVCIDTIKMHFVLNKLTN